VERHFHGTRLYFVHYAYKFIGMKTMAGDVEFLPPAQHCTLSTGKSPGSAGLMRAQRAIVRALWGWPV
jgi:hypothetical protein